MLFNENQLYVYNKINSEQFFTNVCNVACRNYFYDFPYIVSDLNKDSKIVEKLLSLVDTKFCETIKKIIDDIEKCNFFDPIVKIELSPMVLIQATRTFGFREGSKLGLKSFIDKNIRKVCK